MRLFPLLLLLCPALAWAQAGTSYFLGVDKARSQANFAVDDSSGSGLRMPEERQRGASVVKVGVLYPRSRFYLARHTTRYGQSDTTARAGVFHWNYLFFHRERTFNIFLGPALGVHNLEAGSFFADGSDLSVSSSLFGSEAGIMVSLWQLQLEAGARYLEGWGSSNNWTDAETTLQEIRQTYVGLNLIF